jgi:hypothetical protein
MENDSIKNAAVLLCFYMGLAVLEMLTLSLFAHINFLKEMVYIYYYRMLCYIGTASGLLLLILFVLRFKLAGIGRCFHVLRLNSIIAASLISTFFSAFFVTMGPMPIDRSYTIFSIAAMYEEPDKVYTAEDIEQAFIERYIIRNQATQRRIEEQKRIGNIEEIDDGYRITEKGKRLIEMMRLVEKFYPADEKRMLYPK